MRGAHRPLLEAITLDSAVHLCHRLRERGACEGGRVLERWRERERALRDANESACVVCKDGPSQWGQHSSPLR